ncbi:MAG: glycosyltransferase family 4 protein [Planctomycetaceae bacterium]
MHIAIITAGGAGMFCGSCMHDNTWARALMDAGAEVSLIPTYTPIRVDERDVSETHVFMGGVNLYLEHRSRLWRRLPRLVTRPLDHPRFLRLISKLSISNDAAELGDLTLDMLAGERGPMSREVDELAGHITDRLRPDVVIFSNALLAGVLRRLKERFSGCVFCTLQGDDVFIEGLPESHKQQVLDALSERAQEFDGFFTHTKFYRDRMAAYLNLPAERFHVIPLGIDFAGHDGVPHAAQGSRRFTIGYFARIAPEKGLHHLVEAALLLHVRRRGEFVVKVGGYLNPQHRRYLADVERRSRPLGDAFQYIGSPGTLAEKVAFYKSLDVLSVPTEFLEPKGLYLLEALANGVPVVQPAHGAFPELIEATGGGLLVEPKNPIALASALERLLDDPALGSVLTQRGQQNVCLRFSLNEMAEQTLHALSSIGSDG